MEVIDVTEKPFHFQGNITKSQTHEAWLQKIKRPILIIINLINWGPQTNKKDITERHEKDLTDHRHNIQRLVRCAGIITRFSNWNDKGLKRGRIEVDKRLDKKAQGIIHLGNKVPHTSQHQENEPNILKIINKDLIVFKNISTEIVCLHTVPFQSETWEVRNIHSGNAGSI